MCAILYKSDESRERLREEESEGELEKGHRRE